MFASSLSPQKKIGFSFRSDRGVRAMARVHDGGLGKSSKARQGFLQSESVPSGQVASSDGAREKCVTREKSVLGGKMNAN